MLQPDRLEYFLERNRVGLLMRTFATKPDDVPTRVDLIQRTLDRIQNFNLRGISVFCQTDILVWKDLRYNDSDCGQTADALRANIIGANIQEMDGDLFCGLMNSGMALQLRKGIDYTLTISPEANSYTTPETLFSVMAAASKGALVVGVAIDELAESILRGRIANTFAMWHNLTLLGEGGFDHTAAKPSDNRSGRYIRSHDGNAEVYYPFAGVEEMIPLARIFDRVRKPFIAPILPSGEGIRLYEKPTDPELLTRHETKMASKYERQLGMLLAAGFNFSWLEAAVMPEFRQFEPLM